MGFVTLDSGCDACLAHRGEASADVLEHELAMAISIDEHHASLASLNAPSMTLTTAEPVSKD